MDVRLTSHSEELLKQELARGEFQSPEEVIERALETLSEQAQRRMPTSVLELDAALDALAEGSEKLPILPPEASTRAGIYRDHN